MTALPMRPHLRLLPATALAAGLLLSLKAGTLWREADELDVGWADVRALLSVTPLNAQQAHEERPAPGDAKAATAAEHSPQSTGVLPAQPAPKTDAALLSELAQEREALAARERELDLRDKLLRVAEAELEEQLAELERLEVELRALVVQVDQAEEARLRSLVKIYEAMKPKDAARIFERLEMAVLLDMASRIRESKMAPILAAMDPAKANILTTALAQRRRDTPATD